MYLIVLGCSSAAKEGVIISIYLEEMDLSQLLPECQNDLQKELDQIVHCHNNRPTPSQLLEFVQRCLSSEQYPNCSQCSLPLIDRIIAFNGLQLYCLECRNNSLADTPLPQHNQGTVTMNLAQRLPAMQEWTVGDHLQFMVKATELLKERNGVQRKSSLQVGRQMFNKKTSLQVLSYFSFLQTNPNVPALFDSEDQEERFCLLDQLQSKLSLEDLDLEEESLSNFTLFNQFKSQQESNIQEIRQKIGKAGASSELLNTLLLSEIQTNYRIIREVVTTHKDLKTAKITDNFKAQITEDITHDDMKSTEPGWDMEANLSDIERQFQELKQKVPKRKRIRKDYLREQN